MSRHRTTLLLALLWAVVPAAAQDADLPRYRAYVAAARGHLGRANTSRAARSFTQALGANPAGIEALLGLAALRSPAEARVLRHRALILAPQSKAVAGAFEQLPTLLRSGKATRLEAAYLGYCPRAAGIGSRPSLEVGQTVRRALLLIHGLDDQGQLVPVDVTLSGTGGLDQTLVARKASTAATIQIKDRTSGLTASIHLSLIGPTQRLRIGGRHGKVGTGELLHLGVGLYDAAGNRVWVPRLRWSAQETEAGKARPDLLRRSESIVHEDITFEPHRNIVPGPADAKGWTGSLTVRVEDPISDKSATREVELVQGKVITTAPRNPLAWASSFEAGLSAASKKKRPMMIFFYADW